MTFREDVFDRCTGHAGISALIALRCYPQLLPENVTYPALSYAIVSDNDGDYRTHDTGQVLRTVSRVQFNAYATTSDGASALADQVEAAWSGYKDGCTIGRSFKANRLETYETSINRYRHILDFMIEHPVP